MVKGFIITSHYELVGEKPVIHLYGRLEDNRSFEVEIKQIPYFFIRASDKENADKLISLNTEETNLLTLQKEPVIRINVTNPKEVPELRKLLENENIPCFEADIRFTQRFFLDNNILTTINIKGQEEKGIKTDVLFKEPKITGTDKDEENTIKPTMLSFDIETDANGSKPFSISLYNKEVEEVIAIENDALKKTTPKHAILVANERELLTTFLKRVQEIDPDIIVGWNNIDFDLKVLLERAKKLNIPFVLGRSKRETNLRLQSSFFRDSSVSCDGRVVLDGIQLLKSSFVKLDDYKLNTAAKHFLDDSKLIQEDNRFHLIADLYENDPEKFIAYNLKDSELVYDILIKSEIYELTIQRSLLTGSTYG